nr:immunoglobulin heavy chain junction region [Macaca mulatta]
CARARGGLIPYFDHW